MTTYEYGRITQLAKKLTEAGIAQEIIDKIMEGGESVGKTATPVRKADWMSGAMDRMDALLGNATRRAIRESCACCLSGKRSQISKQIVKDHATLEDRIKAANEARLVFGHSVTLEDDGRILVRFSPDGQEHYRCVCLPKARGPISITYCYCCGGHAKHHLQQALGKKLTCEVRSSALESDGKRPCTFLFTIEE
jgi:hypothetical protein